MDRRPANVTCCRAAHAGLAVALLVIEGVDSKRHRETIDTLRQWGLEVKQLQVEEPWMPPEESLRRILVDRHGLRGEGEAFYEPRNCHLSEVVIRRQGMPILLSAVWLIVARLVGLDAVGIGMPGHFIIRVRESEILIDPFGGGRTLDVERCAVIVKRLSGLEWTERFLEPASQEAIATRVVRNLQLCHHRTRNRIPLYRMARFNALLTPECVAAQLLHGQVAEMIELEPLAIPFIGPSSLSIQKAMKPGSQRNESKRWNTNHKKFTDGFRGPA